MDGIPDWYLPEGCGANTTFAVTTIAPRSTPSGSSRARARSLSWDAAQRLLGNEESGHLDLEWALTGGVLFGKQKTDVTG